MSLQNLDCDLLDLIVADINSPELIFDGKVDHGLLNDASFNKKVINAFKTNTNITSIELKPPISIVLVQALMMALKHVNHSVELVINQLSTKHCESIRNELSALNNVHVLHLVQLAPEPCAKIMNGLFNAKQIAALELKDLSVDTAKVVMRELPNSAVSILRYNALTSDASRTIMLGLPQSKKVVMLRLIQPELSVSKVVQNNLSASEVYVLDLIGVDAENCKVLMKGILNSKVHVLGLHRLSPDACKVVMDQLPDRIDLIVVNNLEVEACKIVIEKLLKSQVKEVKLVSLPADSKALMESGLKMIFKASSSESDLFVKPRQMATAASTSKTSGIKRDVDNAGIADTSTTTKTARSAVQQTFPSSGMASKITASTSIFHRSTPDKDSAEGSEGHDVDPSQSLKKSREPSSELSFGCHSPENPEITNVDDEPPQRSGEQSPNDFSCD